MQTYIQSWPNISAPLVNMIKEGCENESALLILLIFYKTKSQKSNLPLDKNLKWRKYHYAIKVFFSNRLSAISQCKKVVGSIPREDTYWQKMYSLYAL